MMNPYKASVILRLICGMKRSGFQAPRGAMLTPRAGARFGRFSMLFALIALAAGIFLSNVRASRVFSHSGAMMTSTESVGLFSSAALDTPKTTFNRGEPVWALEAGAPLPSLGARQRRFQWVAPDGTVKQQGDITTNDQSDLYQLSTSAQLGTWLVKTVDNSNNGFAIAEFVVRDPSNTAADLSVGVFGSSQVAAGNNIAYRLQVTNNGPDDAQNVALTNTVSSGANFQSLTQEEGWSCPGGTLPCSIASLARGATAVFTVIYQVSDTVPADTIISNTANVSSNTTELRSPDNTSTADATVTGASTCTFSCPDNITQAHAPGTNGATVNYATPTIASGCDPVICSPPSGSVFPAGATAVICSSLNGGSCSFTVTITGMLAIMLDGPDPLIVECHTEFHEPGATAQNDSGMTFPVSSSVFPGGFPNTTGTYTITYTATDGVNTDTATRTVEVVDTTPPVITLNGNNPMTVAPGAPFVDPGATAHDDCAGSNPPATPSGTVNTSITGIYEITYTATDGTNTGTAIRTVIVSYVFTGFFPPINNDLTTNNVVNAGRAIPVKFSLGGDKGLNIFAPGYPVVVPLNCSNPGSEVQETVTAGESTLSYDSATDQYIYVWKTEAVWAGTCWQLVVKLNDGSEHRANFKFR